MTLKLLSSLSALSDFPQNQKNVDPLARSNSSRFGASIELLPGLPVLPPQPMAASEDVAYASAVVTRHSVRLHKRAAQFLFLYIMLNYIRDDASSKSSALRQNTQSLSRHATVGVARPGSKPLSDLVSGTQGCPVLI